MKTLVHIGLLTLALALGVLPAGVCAGQVSGTCCCQAPAEPPACGCCGHYGASNEEPSAQAPKFAPLQPFHSRACCHAVPLHQEQTARVEAPSAPQGHGWVADVPVAAWTFASREAEGVAEPATGPPPSYRTVFERTSRLLL